MKLSIPASFKIRGRPWALIALLLFIITEIVVLSPSSVEETPTVSFEPNAEIPSPQSASPHFLKGIPRDRIPDYTVEDFHYVSTHQGKKQWKLQAATAHLYNPENLVHSFQVTAYLLDNEAEKPTIITGEQAKYAMNAKDLEVFGSVTATFPDGFVVRSQYMRYLSLQKTIEIPKEYPVDGDGKQADGKHIFFNSSGLNYDMKAGLINLPAAVVFNVLDNHGEKTVIESDHSVIQKDRKKTTFTMNASRPLGQRFVRITQPSLSARSRSVDLDYSGAASTSLKYLVLNEDVLIREKTKSTGRIRYGTGGRADFDSDSDVITLTQFPQVYEDHDTVTGDRIKLRRNQDIVEVEHSNAYSQGSSSP